MKRFYKFLMPLVAIVAMALPWNARAQVTVTIGDGGTSTSSYLPNYEFYNYSLTQQIYTAEEIGMAGDINSISFYTGGSATRTLVVYMINTAQTDFSGSSAWITPTASDQVFSGSVTYVANGWTTITLATPFYYDGVSNLAVIVDDNTGSYVSSIAKRVFTPTSGGNCAIRIYSDGTNYDALAPTSYSGTTMTTKNQIQLDVTPSNLSCYPVRNLTASNIGPWSCTLTWSDTNNAGATYTIMDMADSTILASGISDTTYDLTSLTSDHAYIFGLYAECGGGDESGFARVSVHTLVSCPHPTQLTVDSTTATDIILHWTPGFSETEWAISVGDSLIDGIVDTTYTITGLNANTLYTLSLRAVCGVEDTSIATSTTARTDCEDGSCNIVVIAEDSYGDGWNGNAINVMQGGTLMGSATLSGGSSGMIPIKVCDAEPVTITFTVGSYADEMGGSVLDGGGSVLFSISGMENYSSGATLATVADPCPACMAPVDLAIDTIMPTEITLHWNAGTATEWLVGYGDTVVEGIVTNSYTLTGLDQYTQYSIVVYAVCDNGDTSSASLPITARTTVSCPWPINLTATATGGDTASVTWTAGTGSDATDFYLVYGPAGFNPATIGESNWINVSGVTNYEITGLTAGLWDIYVRADCGSDDGISAWAGPASIGLGYMNIDQVDTLYTCGVIICDNGGPTGSYGTNRNDQVVVYPIDNQHGITISGTSQTEGSWDYLTIYEGVGTSGTILFQDNTSGVSSSLPVGPFDIEGPVTIAFYSDGSVVYDGFQISVMCYDLGGCMRPSNLVCNSATAPDSVVISWNGNGNSAWDIFVGPAGSLPNADSAIAVTDSTYTFTTLNGGVSYDVYVRSDCGSEQSDWRGPLTITPGTFIIGTSGAATISMCGGAIYDDGGPNGQYSNNVDYMLTVYPSSADSMLTFHGTLNHESCCDHLYIYEGVGDAGTVLWADGSANTNQTIPLDTCVSGPITIKWHADGSSVYNGFEIFINCVGAPECSPVEALTVKPTPTAALVTWTPGFYGEYTGATVEYKLDSVETWTEMPLTTGNYVVIPGLDPATDYNVRVTTDCNGYPGGVALANFTTGNYSCLVADSTSSRNITVGTGSSTSSYFPTYSCYNYSLSEQLFTPLELGGGGNLTAITVTPTSVVSANRSVEIYMGHVNANTLSDFVYPTDLTLVYTGTTALVDNQPYTFTLDNAFNYNGSDNLLILFRDLTGSYTCSNNWATFSGTSGISRYVYQDSGPYAIGFTGGYSSSDRAITTFNFLSCLQYGTCAAPAVAVMDATTTSVTVVWAPGNGETSWNAYYRLAGSTEWSAPIAVTGSTYTFTGLNSGSNYEFKIENACSEGDFATQVEAATLCAAIALPYTEDFNGWGTGHLPNCWYNTGAYSPTSYSIISGSQNMTGTTGGSVYMYSSSGSSISRIILPELDTTAALMNQTQLVFNVKYTSTSYGAPTFVVGVMEDPQDITTFVPVDTVTVQGGINQWEVFEVSMANYTGNGAHAAIQTLYPGTYFYCYLDNVTLEMIPTCPRPDSLTAGNATTTTVDVAWRERGSATSWIIEYGPRGFELGTGTQVTATSNPFTLTGVPVAYQGEYYVRSICSASDTGEYSRRGCAFETTQIPATLPYSYDFENATEWDNWQTSTNHATANWYRGTDVADSGSYSMYVAHSDSAYFDYSFGAVVNAAAYRDVDFGPIDSSYTLSFRARVGGTTSASYDGLMVFLVDPSLATVASSQNITSPWGNVNNLYRIATVRLDTTWQTYEASFDTIHGIHRVAFFWFNQNTGASYANIPQAAAVDNIHIRYSTCPRPVELEAAVVGSTTATLTWTGEAGANYEVVYREVGGNNQLALATTNSITLTGLTSNATYRAWVRKVCGAGDTSLFCDGTEFMTTMCDGGTEALNFDPSASATTSSYSPIGYATYNYSYVQTIIDSADLASLGGNITAFGFMPTNTTSSDYYNNMTMYMANVSESDLSGGFIHPDATHVFHKVIDSASFNFTTANEWQIHNLDSAFTWDGHSNLLIAVNREHGTWSSSTSFSAHTATASKMRYVYNDGSAYDPTTVSGGTASSTVGDIRLISCGAASCLAPEIDTVIAGETTVTMNWTGNSASYQVAAMANGWVEPTTGTLVSGLTTTINGLTPNTQYAVGIRAVCGEGLYSEWVVNNVTTLEHPCYAPTNVIATNITVSGADIDWVPGEDIQNNFELRYSTGGDTVTVNTAIHPYTLSGLANSTEYTVSVRAVCGVDDYSDWSAPATFTTATCQPVSGVTVSGVTATTATVSWTGSASGYQVEYGYEGFTQGAGTRVDVSGNSYTITGLSSETSYDVYVRAVCGENNYSGWSDVRNFETQAGNPDDHYYVLTLNVNDPTMGSVTGAGTYLEGTVVTITATPNEGYQFVNWSNGVTAATTTVTMTSDLTLTANFASTQGIDDVDNAQIALYPNPASSTVTLSGIEGAAKVTVVDMNGREVYSGSVADGRLTINVSDLSQGAYFVRITGEKVNAIRKLIVR